MLCTCYIHELSLAEVSLDDGRRNKHGEFIECSFSPIITNDPKSFSSVHSHVVDKKG